MPTHMRSVVVLFVLSLALYGEKRCVEGAATTIGFVGAPVKTDVLRLGLNLGGRFVPATSNAPLSL